MGAVRLPSVSTEQDAVLTRLAIDALKQWKFSPPTSRGRPVLVKASQVFDFGNAAETLDAVGPWRIPAGVRTRRGHVVGDRGPCRVSFLVPRLSRLNTRR